MKAMVLAAGQGRRMRPLTDDRPKTLLEVGGRTIIARIVEGLIANGVTQIVVVTGYRADEVEAHLRSTFPEVRFSFVRNDRYSETNNIFSMALALEGAAIDDDIILVESDLICESALFRTLIDSPAENVALVDRYRNGMDGTVVGVQDGLIAEVIPPHLQHGAFSFEDKFKTLNIYKFSREFTQNVFRPLVTYYARTVDDTIYYELVLGILIYLRSAEISALEVSGSDWAEVDDPNDLMAAQYAFDPESRREILEATKGGYWALDVLDFAYIRNMYFPPPAMYAQLRSAMAGLLQNYGSAQLALDEKLSYFLLCDPARVIALNGASQLFPWLRGEFGGRRAILPSPTFLEWPRALPLASRVCDRGRGIDLAEVESQADDFDVVVFVNPNNPTGSHLPSARLHAYASEHPSQTIIVDESFHGFANDGGLVPLLEREPLDNVLVLTSLSKSLGMPGARIGYAYTANGNVAAAIRDSLPIWNMNSIAEHVLELLLKYREQLAASYERTIADRQELVELLATVPLVDEVFPSAANFVLVALNAGQSGPGVVDELLRSERIYVKDVTRRMEDDSRTYLRIAVRQPHEHTRLVAALTALSDPARPH